MLVHLLCVQFDAINKYRYGDSALRMTNTVEAPAPGLSVRIAEGRAGLRRLAAGLNAVAEAGLVRHDLSPLQLGILESCRRGEASTVTELAGALAVDASMVSRQTARLVGRGLMSRKRLSSDRRTVRLSLTGSGLALAQALADELTERQGLLNRGISDEERAAFAAVAHKMLANLEALRQAQGER